MILNRESQAASRAGIPYQYGGTTSEGMDCSAAVQALYRRAGVSLPRTAEAQADRLAQRGLLWRLAPGQSEASALDMLEKGDLLFWVRRSDPNHITHVMMFYGKERDGFYLLWGAQGTNRRGKNGGGVDYFSYKPSPGRGSVLVAVGRPLGDAE